jgi:16S rRNA (guanine966-N2)-methyltransferase
MLWWTGQIRGFMAEPSQGAEESMSIRVIAGQANGHRLKLVPGGRARPVPDKVKESLFNIIGPGILEVRLLDMFAGTGSVGIEALSRGAAECVFLDNDARAIRTIKENLGITHLAPRAEVVRIDAFHYLLAFPPKAFDFVYVAPPQYKGLWERSLRSLDRHPEWLNPDAWVIAQIDPVEYECIPLEHLVEFDQRKYGSTLLVFYELPGG